MITNEVYMEIEVLRKHGFSLRRIAAEVGCAVNTVRSHLSAGQKPKYERQKKRLARLTPYEAYLRERQAAAHPLCAYFGERDRPFRSNVTAAQRAVLRA